MEISHLLPTGFTARNAVFSDIPAVTNLLNDYSRHLFGTDMLKERDLETEWQLENYRPETHIRLAFDPQEKLAGYMEFWDVNKPNVIMFVWGRLGWEYRQSGLMAYLLAWAEQRGRESMRSLPENLRVVLHAPVPAIDEALHNATLEAGYQVVRNYWRMVIDLPNAPAPASLPDGIEIRSMQPGEERLSIWALREAFKDHWGHTEMPFEEEFERWQHFASHDPDYDPSLRLMAFEQGKVAGFSYCRSTTSEDPNLGWVSTLGVLREWRKRGLGLALLQRSFEELYRRGLRKVGLGVDATSLTGATRLYEKAGMRSDPRYLTEVIEKELRPGVDLSTQALEGAAAAA